ncbi:MAG TPA: protein kinase [Anaerolineales bacterium]|nr:protein kinase [Anaerolineales bacterium]
MGTTLERGALLHKRYRIVEILGQGGMGSVYRAVDENLGVDVAVKENLFTSDEYARQFRLEAVILANLRHPNLPRVTDHFVIGDQGQYLIMDYIEGEDLRQRMERAGSISEEEAILIGAAMCDALQYLHTRKPAVIHRDVKPGNVRITPDGHIYLVDFGLAKLVKGSQATTTGARAMTPGYSPPEQYGTARTDPRTDIYSLGATLYAALTGIIPEDGLSRAMDNVDLTPLRKRNPKVSRKLASAIEKAMAIRPDDRFQSAEEFKQALVTSNVKTQHLDGEITIEPTPQIDEPVGPVDENGRLAQEVPPGSLTPLSPPTPPSSTTLPPQRPGRGTGFWVFLSIFLMAVLIVLVALFIFWSPVSKGILAVLAPPTARSATPTATATQKVAALPSPTRTIPATLADTATFTNTLVPTVFVPSITPTFTPSPTPSSTPLGGGFSQIAFASARNGVPQIFMVNTDGTGLQQITNISSGACQPDWSPDGLRLVFISPCPADQNTYPDANLFIINVDGTGLVQLPSVQTGSFDPAWSPDGNRIAYVSMASGVSQIYSINLHDYVVTPLTQAPTDTLKPDWSRQPAWSPDSKQIIYTGHSRLTNALQIWVMSDLGQDQTLLINRGANYWDFLPHFSPDGKTVLFTETNGAQVLGWLMLFDFQNPKTAQAVHWRSGTVGNHGSYSPDGLWLVYSSINTGCSGCHNFLIYIVRNASGKSPVDVSGDTGENFDPSWRPNAVP